jgi:predicted metal-dependent hydrolase
MIKRRITLADTPVAFKVARSKRRRTIGLKVAEDGLTVTLPASIGLHHAERAVRDKQGWVLDRLEKMAARARPALQGVDGESIGWLGDALPLHVLRHDRARTEIVRETDRIEARLDARLDADMAAAAVRRALHRWRKSQALTLMTPKVEAYADTLGAKRPRVSVREQNRRWGSCSEDGSIRMNARLVAFPEPLIDYVCAHEACHLKVMDHSPRFYALLDAIMPDHRERAKALREMAAPGAAF